MKRLFTIGILALLATTLLISGVAAEQETGFANFVFNLWDGINNWITGAAINELALIEDEQTTQQDTTPSTSSQPQITEEPTLNTQADLSSCQVLGASDTYFLTQNVNSAATCFEIESSNTLLDCQGFTITYGTSASGAGITVNNTAAITNVTIKNCNIVKGGAVADANNFGIRLSNVQNSTIRDNYINTNGTTSNHGITLLSGSSSNTITSNNIFANGSSTSGINIVSLSSFNNVVSNAVAVKGTLVTGVTIGAVNNEVSSNTITANGSSNSNTGIQVFASGNRVISNTVYVNGSIGNVGIIAASVTSGNISLNTIVSSGARSNHGIEIDGDRNVSVGNNIIYTFGNSSHGLFIIGPSNRFFSNIITTDGNLSNAIELEDFGRNNTFTSDILNASHPTSRELRMALGFSSLLPANNTFLNLTFVRNGVSIDLARTQTFEGVELKAVLASEVSNLGSPAGQTSFNKFLNITNTTSGAGILINISYTDAEVAAANLNESTLRMWRYNTSNVWENQSFYFASGQYGVDTVNNKVFANITQFSTFGIFGEENPSLDVNVSACGTLSGADTVYRLNQSVSSSGTCFTISANNVTLDCQGFTINYSQSATGNGINIPGTNYTTIRNCQVVSDSGSGSYAFKLTNANFNTASNNTVTTVGTAAHLFYLETSNYNSILGNRGTGNGNFDIGLFIPSASSNHNTFRGNNLTLTGTSTRGAAQDSSNNNTYTENILTAIGTDGDGFDLNTAGANNTIYNNIFNGTSSSANIVSSQYNSLNTTIQSGINIIGGPFLGGNYYATPSGTGFSDTCTDANSDSICDSSNSLATNNVDYLPLTEVPQVPQICGSLDIADTVYAMTQNVNSAGTCFNIRANNVTLDCQGFMINYSQTTTGYGVNITGFSSAIIKNCNILQQNSGVADAHGILLSSSSQNIIRSNNISLQSSGSFGISLSGASSNNLTLNSITGAHTGVSLQSTSNSNLFISNMMLGATNGLLLISSSSNNFTSNNITSPANGARMAVNSNNNIFALNNIRGVSTQGVGVEGTSSNNFDSNIISGDSYGVLISTINAKNNVFRSNNITAGSNDGISISNAPSNIFISNNLTSTEGDSLEITGSSSNNNTFSNTILVGLNYIQKSDTGSGNNLTNTTFLTSNGNIFFSQNFTLPTSTTVSTSSLNVSSGRAFVNSTLHSFLNLSAIITLTGLSFSNPQIIVDFQDDGTFQTCSAPECNNLSYSGGTFVFNVSSFTTYSVQEAPAQNEFNISSCGSLSQENATYLSNTSVVSPGTCFNVQANNVTLDCRGLMINYSTTTDGAGVSITGYNYTTVKNCSFVQDSTTLTGINAAVSMSSRSNNNLITLNRVLTRGDNSYGFRQNDASSYLSNNTFTFNNISTSGSTSSGIYANFGSNNVFSSNIISTSGNFAYGIDLETFSPKNSIVNNTISTTGVDSYGIFLFSSSTDNVVTSNNISLNGSSIGINFFGSDNNTLNSNVVWARGSAKAIRLSSVAVNNLFMNMNISATNTYLETTGSSTGNNMSNVTFLGINGSVRFQPIIILPDAKTISLANLNITQNRVFLNSSSAQLSFLNTSAEITLSGLSLTNPQPIVDFQDDGTFEVCNAPQCSNLSYSGGTFVFNVSSFTTYSVQEEEVALACGELNSDNTTYFLTQNVSTSGTCFNVRGNNITLDCQGFTIDGADGTQTKGVNITSNSTTIKNCRITDFTQGIDLVATRNVTLYNNSITSCTTGIRILSQSHYYNFTGNTLTDNTPGAGIDTVNSNYGFIFNNLLSGNGYGLFISGHNNTIYQNNVSNNQNPALTLLGSENLINYNALSYSFDATEGYGINLDSVSGRNVFFGNTLDYNTRGNIIRGGNHTIANNTVRNNGGFGGFFMAGAQNNTVSNNTIYNNTYGIGLGSNYNRVYGNILANNSLFDLFVNGHNNTLTANNISASAVELTVINSRGTVLLDQRIGNYSISGSNLVIVNSSSGNLTFLNTSISQAGTNLSAEIIVKNNSVFVNSTLRQGLNTTALIMLTGLSFANPRPIVDFQDDGTFETCSAPQCSNLSYSGGTFVFNVSSFTTYSVQEFVEEFNPNVTTCGNLTEANSSYFLQNAVNSSGTCFMISADNITLDCQGFAINFSTSQSGAGVLLNGTNGTIIKNCNIRNENISIQSPKAIQLVRASHSTINNNTLFVSGNLSFSRAVGLESGSRNNTISNNNITAPILTQFHTSLINADRNSNATRILNNTFTVADTAMQINSHFNIIDANTIFVIGSGRGSNGIHMDIEPEVFAFNNVTNNVVYLLNDSQAGIATFGSHNNRYVNNTIIGTAPNQRGIDVASADNGLYRSNLIRLQNSSSKGIVVVGEPGNVAEDNVFEDTEVNVSGADSYGIFVGFDIFDTEEPSANGNGTRNNFTNVAVNLFSQNGTYLFINNESANNSFENVTFGAIDGSVRFFERFMALSNASLSKSELNITGNRTFLNTTYSGLSFLNRSAVLTLFGLSFTTPQIIVDFQDDGTFETCSAPQCSNLSYSGGTFVFNVSSFTTYSVQEEVTALACGGLSSANTVYNLTQNLNSSGTCFNILANNITLDCAGYTIFGDSTNYGINNTGGYEDITIKNCNILNFTRGIYFKGAENGTIINNSVSLNVDGIRLESGSNNNMVLNNNVSSSSEQGIYLLDGSHNNTIVNNTISSSGSNGITLADSTNNSIRNNVAYLNNRGIFLFSSLSNTITNNTAYSNNVDGIALESGSNNNRITNNTVSSSAVGIHLTSSSNNTLEDNIANSNTGADPAGRGISLESGSNNNILIHNTASSNDWFGIYLQSSNSNSIINNTAVSSPYRGIYLESSASNIVRGNNASANGNHGIGLAFVGSSNNLVLENVVISNAGSGISLESSPNNNNLTGNSVHLSGIYGFNIEGSHSNEISYNSVSNSSNSGIFISSGSASNVINSNHFYNNYYNVYFAGTSINNTATNNNLNSSKQWSIYFDSSSSNNTFFSTNISNQGSWIGYRQYIFSQNNAFGNNITNTTFIENLTQLIYPQTITVPNSFSLDELVNLNLSYSKAFVNSTNASAFNQSARIVFSGLNFTTPQIIVDFQDDGTFEVCNAPHCNNLSYSGGTFVFNVSSFTTYSVQEEVTAVDAPVNFSIGLNYSNLSRTITLNWSAVGAADGYMIWYSENSTFILGLNSSNAPVANVTIVGAANNNWTDDASPSVSQRYYALAAYKSSVKNFTADRLGKYDIFISSENAYGHDMISLPLEQNLSIVDAVNSTSNGALFLTVNRSTNVSAGDSATFVYSFFHNSLGGWNYYPGFTKLEFGKGYFTDNFASETNFTNIGRIPTGNVSQAVSGEQEFGHDMIGFQSLTAKNISEVLNSTSNGALFLTVNRSTNVSAGGSATFVYSFFHNSLGGWNYYINFTRLETGIGYFTDNFATRTYLNYTRSA